MKILIIDLETTGLSLLHHEPIQAGFLLFEHTGDKNFNVIQKKEFNFEPLHLETANPVSLKMNGFNVEAWRTSLPIYKHFGQITNLIESADMLLGQNLIFDLRFLKQAYSNFSVMPPTYPKYIDTKHVGDKLVKKAKKTGIGPKKSNLENLCEHYNIKFVGKAHTALVDCERTFEVFKKMVEDDLEMTVFTFQESYDPYGTKT